MEITKKALEVDIENAKAKISELVGTIKYCQQLIAYLDKKEQEKPKDKKEKIKT